MPERRLNPDYVQALCRLVNRCPYFTLLSMEIRELGWGTSLVWLDLGEKHLQPFGKVHGGAIASALDAAVFWSVFTQIDEGRGLTTVEVKLNYLAPARSGGLLAHGRCIKIGRNLGLGDAQVFDLGGNLVAHGLSTVMILPELLLEGDPALPPKFL
jgi:uncharacterized protein (TIGR00369 family)